MSTKMSGTKDWEWKVEGVPQRWPSTSMWGPVAAEHHVFLSDYTDDIPLTLESFSSLKIAALCLWLI